VRVRRIYYRKKGKSIIIEGRLPNNKPLGIWTLPDADKFVSEIIENASFLTKEKRTQIKEKFMRLDFRAERVKKSKPKVLLLNIVRTQNSDAENENINNKR